MNKEFYFSHQIFNGLVVKAKNKKEAIKKLLENEDWRKYEETSQYFLYDERGKEILASPIF